MSINFPSVIKKFDKILERGLCTGVGSADGQMCIEAAITQALGLPFNDDPDCVTQSVRAYKIRINDSPRWKSPASRAEALRDIGIAQIGSRGIVDDREFAARLTDKTARILIPVLFREVLKKDARCMSAADRCEKEGTVESLRAANAAARAAAASADAARATAAYDDAAYDDDAANAANAANAAARAAAAYANAAAYAAAAAHAAASADAASADAASADAEKYLLLSVSLALEVLRELKSPGCEWIGGVK